jgi:hypothetical protein
MSLTNNLLCLMDSYGIDHHFDYFNWPNLFVSRSFEWKLPWWIRVSEAKATLLPDKPKFIFQSAHSLLFVGVFGV